MHIRAPWTERFSIHTLEWDNTLGILLDSQFLLKEWVAASPRGPGSAFLTLFVEWETLLTVTCALITSRLTYCNGAVLENYLEVSGGL